MSSLGNEIVEAAILLQEKIQKFNNKHGGSDVFIVIGSIGTTKHFSANYGEAAKEAFRSFNDSRSAGAQ